ncbi:glycoside hydrolase family 72 protein [Punctularia strigosozonata HHB-11173 SS5]|uniref:glycoside hydrolase family 72 protein n=1 Tax=Punctularia strigosozonata (strain HHB-11173) TaxID=741275 RepID=UPI0004418608|nr:glycoside hydrolase family 72 protein [Punctularia strigosozonata HHB-11173 SS5]EIN13413.1 glycoside hydrolase family 72 protein [Punctularia strigosozonata HHB-11173 SS5]
MSLMLGRAATAVAAFAAFASGVNAISKISVGGRYLYDDSGNRFYIKGIAYQPQGEVIASSTNTFGEPSTFTDPLANATTCSRDVQFLTELGVNTIRAYSVNSSLNHDDCMSTFSNAGIYTIIDLSLPNNGSIDRDSPSWATNLQDQYLRTIDAFSAYDNVLAYNVGNEVVINSNGTGTAAFLKAAARDVKAYLKSKGSSALVGYAAIDASADWRQPLASYLACDPSDSNSGETAIDLYGLNNYEWCGDSSFQSSYAGTQGQFAGYNVPAYFSEFGCLNGDSARPFTEVSALLSSQMSDVWSGGLAFSYFPATSAQGQFGMVTISDDGSTVTTSQDFDNLKSQYTSATPPNTPSQSNAGSTSYPSCPSQNATWLASTTLPGTPSDDACSCLDKSLSCQFKPHTTNGTEINIIIGDLIDFGCSLLGQMSLDCNAISGSGSQGVYGDVQSCDPATKLSFVMSQYYEANNRDPQACSFAGNGTVNTLAPSKASAAQAAESTCVTAGATGTFVPSSPPVLSAAAATSSASSSATSDSSSSNSSGAVPLLADSRSLVGIVLVALMTVAGGLVTLA